MKQWSEIDINDDAEAFIFSSGFYGSIFCIACRRPNILEEGNPHTCRHDINDNESTAWSKNSTSSIGKTSRNNASSQGNPKRVRKSNLDLDRHCGVLIAPSGVPCMRSLTCKSHAAASKRAIIGRSADFDVLLARFIAKNPSKAVSSKQVNVEDKCMQSEKKPRIIESNHKKMTLPLILNKCSPFLSTKYQPFTDNLRYSWFSRNIKSWLSEPLKLYAQSRKAIDQSNNRS